MNLVSILIPLGVSVVVPIVVVYLSVRLKMNKDKMNKEIILAALEKNADVDFEDLIKKMNGPKNLKEKLLNKLQTSIIMLFLGFGFLGCGILIDVRGGSTPLFIMLCFFCGIALLAVGVAYVIGYRVGKKMLAKEIEAESKALESEKA